MIERGSQVRARTAEDAWVTLRATTGVTQGIDFPVVWLLEEDRWADAIARGLDTQPHALPWPADDVRPVEQADEAIQPDQANQPVGRSTDLTPATNTRGSVV